MNFIKKLALTLIVTLIIIILILSNYRLKLFIPVADENLIKNFFAHRGLYDENHPENSLSAFQNAIDQSYAIELDVIETKDKIPVIFHDDNVQRMTGFDKKISDMTLSEIKSLFLLNTSESIPTLKETLAFINGKTPILIEIKNAGLPGSLEENVLAELKNYQGYVAIQSYNALSCKWFLKNAPQYSCGLIGNKSIVDSVHLRRLRDNLNVLICRPNFLNYKIELINEDPQFIDIMRSGIMVIGFTVSETDALNKKFFNVNNLIIEIENNEVAYDSEEAANKSSP